MSDLSDIDLTQLAWAYADALDRASHARWQATQAEEAAGRFRAELAARLTVGEVVLIDDDTMLVMEPPRPGRRSVSEAGIHAHIEVLGPLGLGPQDDPRPRPPKYPTLAELERREAVLNNFGITLDELVIVPPPGDVEVVVRSRKPEEVSRSELPGDRSGPQPAPPRAQARAGGEASARGLQA